MEFDNKELKERKYTEAYSEPKLFDKIKKFAKKSRYQGDLPGTASVLYFAAA